MRVFKSCISQRATLSIGREAFLRLITTDNTDHTAVAVSYQNGTYLKTILIINLYIEKKCM